MTKGPRNRNRKKSPFGTHGGKKTFKSVGKEDNEGQCERDGLKDQSPPKMLSHYKEENSHVDGGEKAAA